MSLQEDGSIGSTSEYLRRPHIRDQPDCSSTRCIKVQCPQGPSPEWREILVRPTTQSFGNLVDERYPHCDGSAHQANAVINVFCQKDPL